MSGTVISLESEDIVSKNVISAVAVRSRNIYILTHTHTHTNAQTHMHVSTNFHESHNVWTVTAYCMTPQYHIIVILESPRAKS